MHEVLKTAFSDKVTGRIQTSEWFTQFRHVEISVKDCEYSGQPSTGYADKETGKVHKTVN
jgi:hypothetical protein